MFQSMIIYIALAAVSIKNVQGCNWCNPPDIAQCISDPTGWTLVRAIGPTKGSWFNNVDSLQGTDAAVDNNKDQFNIGSFENAVSGFNQYLFVTGDCSSWLITSKDAVGGPINNQYYSNAQRSICASSERVTQYTAAWYNRNHCCAEDPWISTIDHGPAIGQGKIVYGERNFGSTHAATVIGPKNGVYVYIRNAGVLDANGCATDPCAGKDCDNGIYCDGEEYCDPDTGDCKAGENVECPENMLCSNDDATCVRDCDSFAIDEYLTECSSEWNQDQIDIENLRSDTNDNKEGLKNVDTELSKIKDEIKQINNRIDGFGPYNPAQAEGINYFGYNDGVNTTSGYFDQYKDVIIVGLLLMNMVMMIISCYMYSKKNTKKYRVVAMQESDDEERAFKK